MRNQPPTFTDVINAEDAQVKSGNATGCAHTCPGACHGGHTCLRATHGDDVAHVGRQPDGSLVQWIAPCDEDTHAAAQAAAGQAKADRAAQTRAFLGSLDADVIADFFGGAAR